VLGAGRIADEPNDRGVDELTDTTERHQT